MYKFYSLSSLFFKFYLFQNKIKKDYINFVKQSIETAPSKLSMALFLPSLISHVMTYGAINSIHMISKQKLSVESLISLIQMKIADLDEDELNAIDESIFNLVEYEKLCHDDSSDPNECFNRHKLNCLCSYFILNEKNEQLNERLCQISKLIVSKWPSLVRVLKIVFFKSLK